MNKKARYDVVANVERWSRKQIRQTPDEFWSYSVWGIGEAGRLPHAAWQSGVLAAWSGEGRGNQPSASLEEQHLMALCSYPVLDVRYA